MARKKTDNPFPDYIRVREPNKEKLAELVLKAKGENRSISAFARDCGVSTSTLTRLINMETSKANSDDLIIEIAKNVSEDSDVTLDMLLEAHGLMKVFIPGNHDISNATQKPIFFSHFASEILQYNNDWEEGKEKSIRMLNIVTKCLYQKKEFKKHEQPIRVLTGQQCYYSYLLKSMRPEDYTENDAKTQWGFQVHYGNDSLMDHLRKIFGIIYTADMTNYKLSVITANIEDFFRVKRFFGTKKIKDCISVILVNIEGNEVVEEFQFPMIEEWSKKFMIK